MTMDRDYAELSLRIGIMAAAIDNFFESTSIVATVREHAKRLTPDLLTTLETGAVKLGVPQSVIDNARQIGDDAIANDAELKRYMAIQNELDARKVQ